MGALDDEVAGLLIEEPASEEGESVAELLAVGLHAEDSAGVDGHVELYGNVDADAADAVGVECPECGGSRPVDDGHHCAGVDAPCNVLNEWAHLQLVDHQCLLGGGSDDGHGGEAVVKDHFVLLCVRSLSVLPPLVLYLEISPQSLADVCPFQYSVESGSRHTARLLQLFRIHQPVVLQHAVRVSLARQLPSLATRWSSATPFLSEVAALDGKRPRLSNVADLHALRKWLSALTLANQSLHERHRPAELGDDADNLHIDASLHLSHVRHLDLRHGPNVLRILRKQHHRERAALVQERADRTAMHRPASVVETGVVGGVESTSLRASGSQLLYSIPLSNDSQ
eukprot:CAMPEP_0114619390 /NCGR_PEP_ID=MMETSP0168-20121206/8190_1 /TAXON_ID=95228 ORGANISM="Vannella sp., Strain DIVA3 517/6/12" /NCGR_SAMPLE_ID=MMETSP0168 /ASSEMBLY_ACC=CAM_ASM_000044 /LENGTH=340 /DNA_ID=CAMNT_0001830559 /DNA_START=164 /DNA_END=1187 /DNA_ORIENTATION=+